MHDGALYVQDALAAGARGFVTKSSAPDERVDAIRAVGRGETYLGSDVRDYEAEGSFDGHSELPELTEREAQVFLLLARGHSVARVAATVGINAKTAYANRTEERRVGNAGVSKCRTRWSAYTLTKNRNVVHMEN